MFSYCLKSRNTREYLSVRRSAEPDSLELIWVEGIEDSLSFGNKRVAVKFARANDCNAKPMLRLVREAAPPPLVECAVHIVWLAGVPSLRAVTPLGRCR